ncbi:enoyl-ACP reductase FabV [Vibrio hippocampi]|uniref:Enoyl-[acyl-carrier-protein] reductase [NADH] n=1 Tax=Vibrio hippocampi TaxID=654686 RepID=A0ABM8ZMY2_9VIBR|nr:enoyl-ACP reductase FabV [Vibrio hippocampi]CAH0529587.1 Trans-2-enoyl-CoA reductase [NADH] [Vibrio hippocampi]
MHIQPLIDGVIARTAHPFGCQQSIDNQIAYVKRSKPIKQGPKRVLILGASSGFGLAARIALTFGGAEADTIGVSYERGPSDKGVGSAGWYNNIFFKQRAQQDGRIAINIVGDAFSSQVQEQVIEAIETYFEGEVDLVIYSLASAMRPKGDGNFWRSAIKPIGNTVSGATINLETQQWVESELPPATEDEIEATLKVMGGEVWEQWVDLLINSESVSDNFKTIAFSYIGPEVTHPLYLDGTLGRAKVDLHQASHSLNLKLSQIGGSAYATVCKALVTKASVFIPGLSPYLLALYRVMKNRGNHEECIEQMQRLFSDKLYGQSVVPVDNERLLRMDDWELESSVQNEVMDLLAQMDANNFKRLGDFEGYYNSFLNLNGFGLEGIDYSKKLDLAALYELNP